MRGTPYHPATNGLANRLVSSFKRALKADQAPISTQRKLDRYLLAYPTAPHTVTEVSPAQLMFGRNLRTRLDLVKPDVRITVENKLVQKENTACRSFEIGQSVTARNYRPGPKWLPGKVHRQTGPVSYEDTTTPGGLI